MSPSVRLTLSFGIALIIVGGALGGLTPKERALARHAQAGVEKGIQDNAALGEQLQAAQQAANDSATSASAANEKALKAEGQSKREHDELVRAATENAQMRPIVEEVQSWWGIGGIIYGFKRLAVHMLILTAALVVLFIVVMVCIPAVIPFARAGFGIALRFLTWLEEAIAALLARIFHGAQPAPEPPPAPLAGNISIPSSSGLVTAWWTAPPDKPSVPTEPLRTETAVAATVPQQPKKDTHAHSKRKPPKKKNRRAAKVPARASSSRARARRRTTPARRRRRSGG